ncbi:N-acetylmuramoyl-L-alanine amidase [Psychroserpens luteolus]|uniref:N-acetylmuramoyl-L-alanine amidase n=1 Tax=Psychroserpens luteolus TaxID=2855840 RepID=UPI001E5ADD88|nr:N-acetylmuramoyl-L-alanine amidase [Psychroserpens luteolus]MCD2259904.1 N-acetylmuramoyl-L-alanine amidase [Psychroserpens luteolus]
MIDYLFYTLVSLGGSFLVYHFVLKQQKTFQFNRAYLLITLILCLLAPLMEIEILDTVPSITELSIQHSENNAIAHQAMNGVTVSEIKKPDHTIYDMIWYVYLAISLCFVFRFIKNLVSIITLTRQDHVRHANLKLIEGNESKNPSSFFNYLFINSDSLEDDYYSNSMIQHEVVHCNHWHSLDVLFIEFVLCVLWFNPFVWLYKKAITQNHEFIADHFTIKSGIDIDTYSQLIIGSNPTEYRVPFTSGFNFIQIKNRIIMLHQSKSSVFKRTLKVTTALLLFSGIFMLSSFKDLKKPIVVVIDAAHGGSDPGQLNEKGHLNEKDIVLNISNALAQYSNEDIKIITLRDEDKFLSLNDRVKFINAQKPDLLISLHCNGYKDKSENGVEAFYYSKNEYEKKSYDYSEILIKNQLKSFSDRGVVKQASFYILKNSNCPAVLLELGFITNERDRAILTDKNHQKIIAKSIYKSLEDIRGRN